MTPEELLDAALLERFRGRAAVYDAENRFADEDLAELAGLGYLRLFVPVDIGGFGWGMQQVAAAQRRLASAAPATALAVNMHLVWTGVAYLLRGGGDHSLDFMLTEAAAGEIFAFGVSEAGNDSVLFDSGTAAVPAGDGSYAFTGTKIFTSLAPVWTRLGIFGKDTSVNPPELVYGLVHRSDAGHETLDDWNTMGMRASQSRSTRLTGALVPPERMFRRVPVGPNPDPINFAIFGAFLTLLSAVYTGLADRALELAVENAHRRTSLKNAGRPYAQDPDIRWKVADAAMLMLTLEPMLNTTARDLDERTDHGSTWFPRLVSLKSRATETALDVTRLAMRVSGGGNYFRGRELERLYRDALAGIYHPSDDESAHSTVAGAWLGPVD